MVEGQAQEVPEERFCEAVQFAHEQVGINQLNLPLIIHQTPRLLEYTCIYYMYMYVPQCTMYIHVYVCTLWTCCAIYMYMYTPFLSSFLDAATADCPSQTETGEREREPFSRAAAAFTRPGRICFPVSK